MLNIPTDFYVFAVLACFAVYMIVTATKITSQ
jgi:hypothetical protein